MARRLRRRSGLDGPRRELHGEGFGLYDALGNVWKWVQDCWNKSYDGAPSDSQAWERGECGRRVVRGDSWIYGPRSLRSASQPQ